MNTPSLELSKELYELSGWHDTGAYGYYKNGSKDDYAIQYQNNKEARPGYWWYEGINGWAAYDLGFLIRQLPPMVGEYSDGWSLEPYGVGWIIRYNNDPDIEKDIIGLADTPEDAAAKLCISLIRQGILPAAPKQTKEEE